MSDRRVLVILARTRVAEFADLCQSFAGFAEVIIDRRVAERRQASGDWPGPIERRRGDRRSGDLGGTESTVIVLK
jgi:hypothetical protein